MHGGKTVSVVFPAYSEEQYIRPAMEDFLIGDVVDIRRSPRTVEIWNGLGDWAVPFAKYGA